MTDKECFLVTTDLTIIFSINLKIVILWGPSFKQICTYYIRSVANHILTSSRSINESYFCSSFTMAQMEMNKKHAEITFSSLCKRKIAGGAYFKTVYLNDKHAVLASTYLNLDFLFLFSISQCRYINFL